LILSLEGRLGEREIFSVAALAPVVAPFVMSSGNVTLHPFNSGAAAMLRACPERVERETSLDISD
jgi:hypothetical protein